MLKKIKSESGSRSKFLVKSLLHNISPFGVLLLGLVLTGLAWHYTSRAIERDRQNNFQLQVSDAEKSLDLHVKNYINILQASQGLFAASQSVERDEWKAFVQSLDLQTLYPGIRGMGFIRYVPNSRKASYEQRVRLDTSIEPNGYPDFAIKPAGERAYYFAIEYIEPLAPNRAAFGFDINSEPIRRAAAQRARDTGLASATEPIVLVQDPTKQPGLLIMLPVYRRGMPDSTVEERRRALLGFVYAPLVVGDLIENALSKIRQQGLELEIYDGKDLMYASDRQRPSFADGVPQVEKSNLQPLWHRETILEVAGETWRLYFTSQGVNQASWQTTPILVLCGGTLISFLVFGVMRSLASSQERAARLATRMTAALSKVNAELKTEIQERKQVEEALKETTRLQNAILDSANYSIISTTVDGTIQTFNAAAERWLGYTASEVIGKTTPAIIHDLDETVQRSQELSVEMGIPIEPGFEVFVAKARLGKSDEREWTYISKNGTRFPVLLSITALYDERKNLTGFLRIGSNITERKKAEKELRQREEFLQRLIASSVDCIKVLDLEGHLLFMSAGGQSLLEIEDFSCYQNAVWFDFWKEQDREAAISAIEIAKRGGIGNFQGCCLTAKGTPKWWEVVVTPILNADGQAEQLLSVSRDITERKQMELKINESEQRFRIAFNDAAIGMALISPEGTFLQVNRSLCEIVGYSEAEIKMIDFQSITHPDDLDANLSYVRQMLDNEICTYQMEKRYIHKCGQIVWILLSVSLVRDKLGKPLYFIAQIQNISDAKHREVERKQIEERITASLTEKEILIKEVHHRVKNNLQIIDSLFRHQCRYIKEAKVTQILKECQNRVSSMALLHEKLYQSKDLARIDVAEYLKSLIANLYESYKVNDISPILKVNVKSIFVELEIALTCGLIINELVSNCLKYAFPKGRTGYLQIQLIDDENGNFNLIVKDNGIGLPEDFALEKTNSLGLKLVKSFVRQLEGAIEVNTDRGTEFTILFRG